jgi:WD40 repeat protein
MKHTAYSILIVTASTLMACGADSADGSWDLDEPTPEPATLRTCEAIAKEWDGARTFDDIPFGFVLREDGVEVDDHVRLRGRADFRRTADGVCFTAPGKPETCLTDTDTPRWYAASNETIVSVECDRNTPSVKTQGYSGVERPEHEPRTGHSIFDAGCQLSGVPLSAFEPAPGASALVGSTVDREWGSFTRNEYDPIALTKTGSPTFDASMALWDDSHNERTLALAALSMHPSGEAFSAVSRQGWRKTFTLNEAGDGYELTGEERRGAWIAERHTDTRWGDEATYHPDLDLKVLSSPIAFSPNGRLEASVHPTGAIELRDVATGEEITRLHPGPQPVGVRAERIDVPVAIDFSDDGARVAVAFEGGLGVWSCL